MSRKRGDITLHTWELEGEAQPADRTEPNIMAVVYCVDCEATLKLVRRPLNGTEQTNIDQRIRLNAWGGDSSNGWRCPEHRRTFAPGMSALNEARALQFLKDNPEVRARVLRALI